MADSLRLDKFLWFARIVKTRSAAQTLAEDGRIRIAGRVIDRAHAPVRVRALGTRRGPAQEAQALYEDHEARTDALAATPALEPDPEADK